jgi:hypothetical protein
MGRNECTGRENDRTKRRSVRTKGRKGRTTSQNARTCPRNELPAASRPPPAAITISASRVRVTLLPAVAPLVLARALPAPWIRSRPVFSVPP